MGSQPIRIQLRKILRENLAGNFCRKILQENLVGNSCGEILQEMFEGKSCGKCLREILAGKCCEKFLQENLALNSCVIILWEMFVEKSCRKCVTGPPGALLFNRDQRLHWKNHFNCCFVQVAALGIYCRDFLPQMLIQVKCPMPLIWHHIWWKLNAYVT